METISDLQELGLEELGEEKLQNIEGGGIFAGIAGFVGAALLGAATVEIIVDGSAQCWEDFKEGYRSTQQ